jgi:hypothetical protein
MSSRPNELYEKTVFDTALRAIHKLGLDRFAELFVREKAAEAEKLTHLLNKKLSDSRPSGG